MEEIVVGDLLYLFRRRYAPCGCEDFDLEGSFRSASSALTGESEPVEKLGNVVYTQRGSRQEMENLAFMGSNVSERRCAKPSWWL